jgi:2'-5' RNA ligase
MNKKRLFTAIDLPDAISGKIRKVCDNITGVRWTKPEQMHLTLSFIGDTDIEMIPRLSEALGRLQFTAFELTISGTGFFRSGIFFLKPEESPALTALKKQIDTVLNEVLEYEPDIRDFIPHITLARFKRRLSGTKQRLLTQEFESIFPVSLSVDKFILYSSKLNSEGAIHVSLELVSAQEH